MISFTDVDKLLHQSMFNWLYRIKCKAYAFPSHLKSTLCLPNLFSALSWYLSYAAGWQYPYDAPHLAYIFLGYWAESKTGSSHDWWGNGILIQLLSRHPVAISACQPSTFGNQFAGNNGRLRNDFSPIWQIFSWWWTRRLLFPF